MIKFWYLALFLNAANYIKRELTLDFLMMVMKKKHEIVVGETASL